MCTTNLAESYSMSIVINCSNLSSHATKISSIWKLSADKNTYYFQSCNGFTSVIEFPVKIHPSDFWKTEINNVWSRVLDASRKKCRGNYTLSLLWLWHWHCTVGRSRYHTSHSSCSTYHHTTIPATRLGGPQHLGQFYWEPGFSDCWQKSIFDWKLLESVLVVADIAPQRTTTTHRHNVLYL